jgi:hypothetical protein
MFPDGPATTPGALAFDPGDTISLTVTGLPSTTIFSFELPTGTVVASSPSPLTTTFTCSNALAVPAMPPFALIGLFGLLLIAGAVVLARRRGTGSAPLGA